MNENWTGLNLADLIERLEPVPEPPAISMMPQTAGWIWLGLLVLALISWLIWSGRRRWNRNAYRRQALRELPECTSDAAKMAELLRRTALGAYPRDKIAALYGQEWLVFLDESYGGTGFTRGPGQQIALAPYKEVSTSTDLTSLVRVWIKTHRRGVS